MKLAPAALVVLILTGASEPPTPSAGNGERKQEQTTADHSDGDTKTYQRGTDDTPVSVKLLNTGKSEAEATRETEQINTKAADDRWATNWTIGLTIALVVATLLQFGALFWQTTYVRRSVQVAERALVEVERPWIFRGIVTIRWRDKDAMKPNDWWVKIAWKNVGRMPALIDRIEFKIKDKKTLPSAPDYEGADILAFIPSLAQDQEHETGEVGIAKATDDSGAVIEYVFFGRVIYREMNGTQRRSGFAISLSPHFPAAVEFNNAAYNYYT